MAFLERNANRGSISTGYDIDNSLKLERGNSEKLSRTPSSASNSKKWTYSFWLKRTQLGINSYHLEAKGSGDRFFILGFNENDNLLIYDIYSDDYGKVLRMKFRDIAAWYHIVLAIDTTDGTAGNRNKFYVNGVLVTDYVTDYGDFPQNHDTQINKAVVHNIGYRTDINQYASGYQAETCLIDGAALAPTSFGEFDDSGIWKPIDVTELTFGTNGFYQEYESSSALGADTVPGGNSNDYAASNIAAADQATDTPTNNFATSNFLISQGGYFVTTEGGTKCVLGTAGPGNNTGGVSALSTIAVSKGKWYMEMKNDLANDSVDSYARFGFVDVGDLADGGVDGQMIAKAGSAAGAYFGGTGGGRYHYNNTAQGNSTTWIRQVMGMALDLDNRKAYFHIDGTYTNSGDPANGTDNGGQYDMNTGGDGIYVDETWVLGASAYNLGIFLMNWGGYTVMPISSAATDANGYGTFEYAPPTGYYALCSKNLAEYG